MDLKESAQHYFDQAYEKSNFEQRLTFRILKHDSHEPIQHIPCISGLNINIKYLRDDIGGGIILYALDKVIELGQPFLFILSNNLDCGEIDGAFSYWFDALFPYKTYYYGGEALIKKFRFNEPLRLFYVFHGMHLEQWLKR